MKKFIKIFITTLILGGAGSAVLLSFKDKLFSSTEVLAKTNSEELKSVQDKIQEENIAQTYTTLCKSNVKEDAKSFDFDYNSMNSNTLNAFLDKFENSLTKIDKEDNNNIIIYHEDNETSYMIGYVEGLGNIYGVREAICGDNEFSSWVYSIENKYFSRITLSSKKLEGYSLSKTSSNLYYKSETWYSNEDLIKTPSIKSLSIMIYNEFEYAKENNNFNVELPTFNDNYLLFEGLFLGLDNETTELTGVANTNYNYEIFSSNEFSSLAITDFNNFWHYRDENAESYILKGYFADIQISKLLEEMFSVKMNPCDNFEKDCRAYSSKKEVCEYLGSVYNPNSIHTQFLNFSFEFVNKEYYDNNYYDINSLNCYGVNKTLYENLQEKPFIKVYECNESFCSLMNWSPNVLETEVLKIK